MQIVHFIRHAEGTHNEAARRHGEGAYKDWAWEVRCAMFGGVDRSVVFWFDALIRPHH